MSRHYTYEEKRDLIATLNDKRGTTAVVNRSYEYNALGIPTNRTIQRQGKTRNDVFTHNDLWLITWDPTQTIAPRPLAIQKDSTWYYAPARPAAQGTPSQVCSGLGGWLLKPHPAPYGLVTTTGNTVQPLQWSSEFTDTDLGLVYYNYRHYNPLDGRWTGRDAEFFSINLYLFYVSLNLFDFLGLMKNHVARPCCRIEEPNNNCRDKFGHLICLYECRCPKGYEFADLGARSVISSPCSDGEIIISGSCSRKRRSRQTRSVEESEKDLQKEQEPQYSTPEPSTSDNVVGDVVELVGWALLFSAAVVSPFDGPAGDIAAGSILAAKAARLISRIAF